MPKRATPLSEEAKDAQRNLAHWRASRNLTLAALAEQTGVAVSTLSGWELGTRAVDIDDLRKLAPVYGVSWQALLFAPKDGSRNAVAMGRAADLALKLPEKQREHWLETGQMLAGPASPEKNTQGA